MLKICKFCGSTFQGRKERQFCSKDCADKFRTGKHTSLYVTKTCEWCGKEFELRQSSMNNPKKCRRFCSTSCSALWRNKTYGPNHMTVGARKKMGNLLHERWQDETFRQNQITRMRENNPTASRSPEDTQKMVESLRAKGVYVNRYKYGNGKISKYERLVKDFLLEKNFYYNYAIGTKLARDAFPEDRFASNYKPDFVNLQHKICIEIDGHSHDSKEAKMRDAKKDKCLTFLGFKVFRFTHAQIDSGEFYTEVDKIWENYCQ